jgi:hypothetical protein
MLTTFLYSVAGGMLAVLSTVRVRLLAWRFVRVIAILVLALAVLPVAWELREKGWSGATLASAITFALVTAAAAGGMLFLSPAAARYTGALRALAALGGTSGILAASLSARAHLGAPQPVMLVFANQILASWLMGSITVAWLLGHAYLTATRMTIAPLRHFSRMLSRAAIARIAFAVICVLLAAMLTPDHGESLFKGWARGWIILFLRVGVGLIGAAAFAYMVADCVRLRATQSATGILYFGSLVVYVGELASQHLLFQLRWPL